MRTFPKSLATFRRIVDERGERLRQLTFESLGQLANKPTEHFTFDSRPSTISIIVSPKSDGSLQVVIQGFMKSWFLGFMGAKHVALDGFYKHPDGTVTSMSGTDFYEFD